jgi:hypothetical protein
MVCNNRTKYQRSFKKVAAIYLPFIMNVCLLFFMSYLELSFFVYVVYFFVGMFAARAMNLETWWRGERWITNGKTVMYVVLAAIMIVQQAIEGLSGFTLLIGLVGISVGIKLYDAGLKLSVPKESAKDPFKV